MFRFTIRDVLWLTVVVALAVGWWINRRQLVSANQALQKEASELRLSNFEIAMQLAFERSTPKGERRIRELLETAKKSPLSRDDAEEVLFEVRHGVDFRTRVRAMAILPYLQERDDAIDALRSALRERGESSADGVIPLYAAKYLAVLKATSAIGDVRKWVDYLKNEPPYDAESQLTLLQNSEASLAELETELDSSTTTSPSD